MPFHDDAPREGYFPNVILTRMRRRTGRIGVVVAMLFALAVALAIFIVCASKSIR